MEQNKNKTNNQHTFWSSLGTMRLHRHVCVQMVQCTISLFTPIPSTFVHTLNFFVTATWTLMLLGTGNRDERVYLFRKKSISFNLSLLEKKTKSNISHS